MFSAAISAEEEANSERVCAAAAESVLAFERTATFSRKLLSELKKLSRLHGSFQSNS
jgi:hypothetical protein